MNNQTSSDFPYPLPSRKHRDVPVDSKSGRMNDKNPIVDYASPKFRNIRDKPRRLAITGIIFGILALFCTIVSVFFYRGAPANGGFGAGFFLALLLHIISFLCLILGAVLSVLAYRTRNGSRALYLIGLILNFGQIALFGLGIILAITLQ